jgi:purine nucleoside phosphorylase
VRVEVEVSPGPSSIRAAGRSRISGHDVERMAAAIRAYQDARVERIVLELNSGEVPRITALMETIARRVMPRFR